MASDAHHFIGGIAIERTFDITDDRRLQGLVESEGNLNVGEQFTASGHTGEYTVAELVFDLTLTNT